MRLDAYYYGFGPTGEEMVDRVLSAVACAGKAHHNTSDWNDNTHQYETFLRGDCPAEWIQNAAIDASAELRAARAEIAELSMLVAFYRSCARSGEDPGDEDVALANVRKVRAEWAERAKAVTP